MYHSDTTVHVNFLLRPLTYLDVEGLQVHSSFILPLGILQQFAYNLVCYVVDMGTTLQRIEGGGGVSKIEVKIVHCNIAPTKITHYNYGTKTCRDLKTKLNRKNVQLVTPTKSTEL